MNEQIIVSKLGSSLIADEETGLHTNDINHRVAKIVTCNPDSSHIFVVSGARAMGLYKAYEKPGFFGEAQKGSLSDKQLAGLGATAVFNAFEHALELADVPASSYPITHHQLDKTDDPIAEAERESLVSVLHGNAKLGIASVINEADAMNDKELMKLLFSLDNDQEIDNDLLAAHIAQIVGAYSLTLWKSSGGLRDEQKEWIPIIKSTEHECYKKMFQSREGSTSGRGGPATTLEALALAANSGVRSRAAGVDEEMQGKNVTEYVLG